jgi:hypothetical protein
VANREALFFKFFGDIPICGVMMIFLLFVSKLLFDAAFLFTQFFKDVTGLQCFN